MSDYYAITFKDAKTGKTAMRLTPEGGLTRHKLFAEGFTDKERAEQVAAEIRRDWPEAIVKVVPF